MHKKIIGIFICMLIITTAISTAEKIKKYDLEENDNLQLSSSYQLITNNEIKKHLDIKPYPATALQEILCEYNLTFYGKCYITNPLILLGTNLAIIYFTTSTEKTISPVANLWYKSIITGFAESKPIPNKISFFALFTRNFNSNMTYGASSYGGYINGTALYISGSYY